MVTVSIVRTVLVFEQCDTLKLDIDWTLPVNDSTSQGKNLLQLAVEQGTYQSVETLLKLNVFDINYKNSSSITDKFDGGTSSVLSTTAILLCAAAMEGYDANNVENCENWKIFCRLLEESSIDLNIRDNYNRDIVAYCTIYDKSKFIDKLKSLIKQEDNKNDENEMKDKSVEINQTEWKMDEASIDETVTKYKIGVAMQKAVANGDDNALANILQLPQAKQMKNELINLAIKSTILWVCVSSTNVSKEKRTKCFKMLLDDASHIEFDKHKYLWHQVCTHGTPTMIELLLKHRYFFVWWIGVVFANTIIPNDNIQQYKQNKQPNK